MIIYLFNAETYEKINISTHLAGMYPITIKDKPIANVYSKDDKWNISFSDEFNTNIKEGELVPYKIYTLMSKYGNRNYIVIAVPKYDKTSKKYGYSGPFSIGNNPNCEICYQASSDANDIVQVIPQQNGTWKIQTSSNYIFVSGRKAYNGMTIKNGDYIFFYGLRVILLGKMLIINNPNNQLHLKQGFFQEIGQEADYKLKEGSKNNIESDEPLFTEKDYFYKAPRLNFIVEEKEIKIDEPPKKETNNDLSGIMVIGPQMTMVATSGFSMLNSIIMYSSGEGETYKFLISLGTMSLMMIGAILWPTITRIANKRRMKRLEKKRQQKYSQYLEKKKRELELIKNEQKQILINNHADVNRCMGIINSKSKELWQRGIEHSDFLDIRIGIGNEKAKIKINEPEEKFTLDDDDNLFENLKEVLNNALINENVPITYNFTEVPLNGIVGNKILLKQFLDCVFLQMLTFHSYTDLKLVIYTKEPDKWEYIKMAPHCWDNSKTHRYFATTADELISISSELEKIFDARVADDEEVKLEDNGEDSNSKKNYKDYRPYYLFFVDDISSIRNVPLIGKLLKYKRNMGFSMIITAPSITELPSETSDFICITEKDSAIMKSKMEGEQKIFQADFNVNNQIDMDMYVQKIANIPIMVEKEKYELPKSLTFLQMYNVGRVEQLNCLSRWEENNPILSLSVPIGIDQNGEIFKMDIHEKSFGPHGLVAGTTGSGKSEWIVTYILSLAVNFNPDEVQFVLIDYKGGGLAKSFENSDLGIKLPHLAGTITNLDKSEIFRSISAIESELKRRQAIFNDAREKLKEGSMNIYKYQQFYRKGMLDEPLSHLLIICDEFAELKSQEPDFMDQLISTSRIGRSLGIHLILATQKPSGVVNEQIWSNSKFKVCLKVQDRGDSNEVLKKPDAAYLKQTGSFYLQVGNDDYYNLGQSAWAGAKYYPSDVIKKQIDESLQYIDNLGQVKGYYNEEETNSNKKDESQGEELLNIVAYISDITKQITIKSPQLWLENIPPNIYLFDLMKKYNRQTPEKYTYNIMIGEYDEPRRQEQGLLEINLEDGNVAIMGQSGSGVDNLVSTIIFSSICEHTPEEINYYIIDFGAETLKKFSKFPQVGEVVFQEEIDNVAAVLDLVIEEINSRKELLSDYNGSFEYYNKHNNKKLPLIVTVINSYDIFIEQLNKISDVINNLFRDAPKYGVIFIVSVGAVNALRQRQLQYFNHLIMLQFNDDTQYRAVTNCRRGLIPKKTLGRGICKLDTTNADSYCEFQTAFISTEEKELEIIKNYAVKCKEFYKTEAKKIVKVPENVTSADLAKYVTTINDVPVGVDYYSKEIAKFDFAKNKIQLLSTKNLNANSMSVIYGISSVLSKIPSVKVRIIDMKKIFKKTILDTKQFDDKIDTVMAAIENDVLTRKETQDWGINIIIGIGSYKKVMSKAGQLIFDNLFNNIKNSKKCLFLLVDEYDKLRTLKVEPWYEEIDETSGIWIGTDVNEQSLITCNEVSSDEKKANFEGATYIIENSNAKLVKAVMDGEK